MQRQQNVPVIQLSKISLVTFLITLSTFLSGCGGGGGGGGGDSGGGGGTTALVAALPASATLANACQNPRSGLDPYNGNQPYPDTLGTVDNEKNWLRSYMDEIYLWYREIPNVNATQFTIGQYGTLEKTMEAYLDALKTPALTPSGKPKDQFSFTYNTVAWRALAQSGTDIGYGFEYAALTTDVPRKYFVAFTDSGSPAAVANLVRGTQILFVDGIDLVNGTDVEKLRAGLFPKNAGEPHVFTVRDPGTSASHDVTLTSIVSTRQPVSNVKTIDTATGRVGYILFNDHFATAEGELIDAISQLKTANVTALVLDIRYNGGGYLGIASELAYMIAGSGRTNGKTFERLIFSDKNPLGGDPRANTPFFDTALGFDPSRADQPLPQLNLSKVYVLTGPNTCSASEAIINGLRGVDVEVHLIGETTCGKPYGFISQDNCGTTYFAIQFQGINNKGYGDYADGFVPTCSVADDFGHALGDPAEGRLAAALEYRTTGICPAAPVGRAHELSVKPSTVKMFKSPLRENRFLRW